MIHGNTNGNEPVTGVEWQRIRRASKEAALDPRVASEIGRLNGKGELDTRQTVAALRIGEIYGAYDRAMEVSRKIKGPSYQRTFAAGPRLSDEEQEARDVKAREAFEDLQAQMPVRLRPAIEELCVDDKFVGPSWYAELRRFFEQLASHWHIAAEKPQHGGPRAGSGRKPVAKPAAQVREHSGKPDDSIDRQSVDQLIRWVERRMQGKDSLDREDRRQGYEWFKAHKKKLTQRMRAQNPPENDYHAAP